MHTAAPIGHAFRPRGWWIAGSLTGAWLVLWTVIPFWMLERGHVNQWLGLSDGRGWEPFLALTMQRRWTLSQATIGLIPVFMAGGAALLVLGGGLVGAAMRWVLRHMLCDLALASLESLRWSLYQFTTRNGLLLLLSLFAIPLIGWVTRELAGALGYSISWWVFAPFQAVYLFLALPVLLSPAHVVGDARLGAWWRAIRLPLATLATIALTIIVGIGVVESIRLVAGHGFLVAVVGICVSTLTTGLISTVLLARPRDWLSARTEVRAFLRAERALPWFGSTLLFGWIALLIGLPLLGMSAFNIFAVPSLLDELRRAGLSEPAWFRLLGEIESLRSAYGSLAFIVVILPIMAVWICLWDQRLAFHLHAKSRAAAAG